MNFISILHVILQKKVLNFLLLLPFINFFLFRSCVRNENVKRPGFYTLQITNIFSNFPQLKQLSNIKNMCEYCDLLELWSELEIWDSYKKSYYDCFFPFLMAMLSSTVEWVLCFRVVPKVVLTSTYGRDDICFLDRPFYTRRTNLR